MLPSKSFFEKYVRENRMPGADGNLLHEFLQMEILQALSLSSYKSSISFLGGTALRFIHKIARFSEDLDFDLVEKTGFELCGLANEIKHSLELKGYSIETKLKTTDNIYIIYWKFSGVLEEFGIKTHRNEKEMIKFEIDYNPPKFIETETVIIESFDQRFPLLVNKLDTIYAQKLLALFFRPYQKGRDFYDLFWFLGKKELEPNYKILKAKGIQISKKEELIKELKKLLEQRDLARASLDVRRFLFDPRQADWITDLPKYIEQLEKDSSSQ